MIRVPSLLTLCLSSLALLFTGCQLAPPTQVSDRGYTAPQSAPIELEVPAEVDSSVVILRTDQIVVTKSLLEEASVGGMLKYRVLIEALQDIGAVRLTETMPEGIEFSSASPAATVSESSLSWMFPSMQEAEVQTIDVSVKPIAEGDHSICSTISVDNLLCLDVFSGQPKLDVVKTGPATVELGEEATWSVAVTNNGSAIATNIVVTDELPDTFSATSPLRQTIDSLAPGETQTVQYSAKAVKQGEVSNRATVSYDSDSAGGGAPIVAGESSSPISIVQSGIRVTKAGPVEAYVFKPVTFEITIENTGDTDLNNVRITDILPKGSAVADNGSGRVSGDAIGWMIPVLPAGTSQTIKTEIAATQKGEFINTVKVLTANGLQASDTATTKWLAVPGVTVSITDSKDPIRVGESTNYIIQVRNQGDFEPVSGAVTITFNQSIKPTAVAGDAQGVINGQSVTFPRTTLEPGKDTNLSITAEGAQIGPGRAIMNFSADFLTDPIVSQETTNVY